MTNQNDPSSTHLDIMSNDLDSSKVKDEPSNAEFDIISNELESVEGQAKIFASMSCNCLDQAGSEKVLACADSVRNLTHKFISKLTTHAAKQAFDKAGETATKRCLDQRFPPKSTSLASNNWTEIDRHNFLEHCKNNAKPADGRAATESVCPCMLKQLELAYPSLEVAEQASEQSLMSIAAECIKKYYGM